jgi:hypothetical protein
VVVYLFPDPAAAERTTFAKRPPPPQCKRNKSRLFSWLRRSRCKTRFFLPAARLARSTKYKTTFYCFKMQSVSRSDCRLWSCFSTKWGSKPPRLRWPAPPRRGAGVAALSQTACCLPTSERASLTAVSSVASRTERGHVSLALPDTHSDAAMCA